MPLVACLTLCLYTPLKQKVFKHQGLLKQQVLINHIGLCNLLFAFAAAAMTVLSNFHMLSHRQSRHCLQLLKLSCNTNGPLGKHISTVPVGQHGQCCQWQVFAAPASLPVLSPADAKAAAAKAKADPKAAAAAAAEAAAALAAVPLQPCSLLSPALAAQLNPVIFTPCKVLHVHTCLTS